MSLASLAGTPSNGRRWTSAVMWAAPLQTGSSSRPSITGGSGARGGRTIGRPVQAAAAGGGGVSGGGWACAVAPAAQARQSASDTSKNCGRQGRGV